MNAIYLTPYTGNMQTEVQALREALGPIGWNIYFDDVDASTCRFCYRPDEDSTIVDYDITWDALESWFKGEYALLIQPQEHDPSRFDGHIYSRKVVITDAKEAWAFGDWLDDEITRLCYEVAKYFADNDHPLPDKDEFLEEIYDRANVGGMRDSIIEGAQDVMDCELTYDYQF